MRILVNHVNANGGVSFRILGREGETAAKIKRHALRETDMATLSLNQPPSGRINLCRAWVTLAKTAARRKRVNA